MGDFDSQEAFMKRWEDMIKNVGPGKKASADKKSAFEAKKNNLTRQARDTDESERTQERLNKLYSVLTDGKQYAEGQKQQQYKADVAGIGTLVEPNAPNVFKYIRDRDPSSLATEVKKPGFDLEQTTEVDYSPSTPKKGGAKKIDVANWSNSQSKKVFDSLLFDTDQDCSGIHISNTNQTGFVLTNDTCNANVVNYIEYKDPYKKVTVVQGSRRQTGYNDTNPHKDIVAYNVSEPNPNTLKLFILENPEDLEDDQKVFVYDKGDFDDNTKEAKIDQSYLDNIFNNEYDAFRNQMIGADSYMGITGLPAQPPANIDAEKKQIKTTIKKLVFHVKLVNKQPQAAQAAQAAPAAPAAPAATPTTPTAATSSATAAQSSQKPPKQSKAKPGGGKRGGKLDEPMSGSAVVIPFDGDKIALVGLLTGDKDINSYEGITLTHFGLQTPNYPIQFAKYQKTTGKIVITKKVEPPAPTKKLDVPRMPIDDNFFERQEGAGCGRHALNNLLRNQYFVRGDPNVPFNITNKTLPFSLQSICALIKPLIIKKYLQEDYACPQNEDYDTNVLIAALNFLGYKVNHIGRNKAVDAVTPNTYGFLVNLGKNADTNTVNHWIALYRVPNTDTYNVIDSIVRQGQNPTPFPTQTLQEFITSNPNAQQFLEVEDNEKFINFVEILSGETTTRASKQLTPLQFAVLNGDTVSVVVLIQAGADFNKNTPTGESLGRLIGYRKNDDRFKNEILQVLRIAENAQKRAILDFDGEKPLNESYGKDVKEYDGLAMKVYRRKYAEMQTGKKGKPAVSDVISSVKKEAKNDAESGVRNPKYVKEKDKPLQVNDNVAAAYNREYDIQRAKIRAKADSERNVKLPPEGIDLDEPAEDVSPDYDTPEDKQNRRKAYFKAYKTLDKIGYEHGITGKRKSPKYSSSELGLGPELSEVIGLVVSAEDTSEEYDKGYLEGVAEFVKQIDTLKYQATKNGIRDGEDDTEFKRNGEIKVKQEDGEQKVYTFSYDKIDKGFVFGKEIIEQPLKKTLRDKIIETKNIIASYAIEFKNDLQRKPVIERIKNQLLNIETIFEGIPGDEMKNRYREIGIPLSQLRIELLEIKSTYEAERRNRQQGGQRPYRKPFNEVYLAYLKGYKEGRASKIATETRGGKTYRKKKTTKKNRTYKKKKLTRK